MKRIKQKLKTNYCLNESSKLFLYQKLKQEIKLEEYLTKETYFQNRQLLSKFRINGHILEVEIGRYKNIPRNQRYCKFYNSNKNG